ncbi:hypothetical protein ACI7RC_13260 [Brevibacillus sp. B_LB10_24]|jgi:hypothetical protein|uniref:hypothetical protein n=1 Tax=Brevibacillus TaxID=55080 RepID=UPI0002D2D771|nr:hypothetical protein [Brevibacillus massiliensis]
MGECKLDHTFEDVCNKLEQQVPHLPEDLVRQIRSALAADMPQPCLNELFHALKKYDLADQEERRAKEAKIRELLG